MYEMIIIFLNNYFKEVVYTVWWWCLIGWLIKVFILTYCTNLHYH